MAPAVCSDADLRSAAVRFYKDAFGRGPRQVRVAVQPDLVVFVLTGVLTAAERSALAAPDGCRARDALKGWHRELLEAHRVRLEAHLADLLPARVQALHHDLSTAHDECLIALRLAPAGGGD